MSQPARRLSPPTPAPAPRSAPPGPIARPRLAPGAAARRRPRRNLAFVVLFSVVVAAMAFGLVALTALLAQSSFRIDDLHTKIDELSAQHLELVSEQAQLSAPGRIAEWARRNGMRLPDDIRILHASDGPRAPAGAADPSGGGA